MYWEPPADQARLCFVWFSVRDELSFSVELQQSLAAEADIKRKQQARVSTHTIYSNGSLPTEVYLFHQSQSFLQVKEAEEERDAWGSLRASFRHLHPALVLPFPPDLLSLTSDHSSLPPPPPPPVEGEGGMTEEEPQTDSPMMWLLLILYNIKRFKVSDNFDHMLKTNTSRPAIVYFSTILITSLNCFHFNFLW